MELKWTAFPLHPEIPLEGLALEELFAGRNVDLDEVRGRLRQTAAALGLPFGPCVMSYNSRLAQELGKWAEKMGVIEPYHQAVYRAYFAEGRNIALAEEMYEIVRNVGLPEGEARRVVEEGRFSYRVDADWERSRGMGVTAVPTFMLAGQRIVGAQPYSQLERFVEAGGVPRAVR